MNALDPGAVWEKSRLFIRRALEARNSTDYADFGLWSAISLEMLGKAILADIHPSLIADPTKPENLFYACGVPLTTSPRTIMAKTVFSRLKSISKAFDQKQEQLCLAIMDRRNSHLHSGELPFEALKADTWAPGFWRAAKLILEIREKTLEDWVGSAEALRALELIEEAATVHQQAVRARIEEARGAFEANYKHGVLKSQVRKLAQNGKLTNAIDFKPLVADTHIAEECPACGCDGLLAADMQSKDYGHGDPDWSEGFAMVTVSYASEAFRCGVCKLRLDGQEELDYAGLPLEFSREEEEEIDDDGGYMNE